MAQNQEKTKKVYEEGRFEFIVYLNNDIVCKRNFVINNFIEHSMETMDFKSCMDGIVTMIDDDLKSKSRVYLWNFYNPNDPSEEFTSPLIDPWVCTFKIVITDNKRPVFEKIWDGYAYPKFIRDKVDLTNKNVRVFDKTRGEYVVYPKEEFFAERGDNLSLYFKTVKGMIMDKQDIIYQITRRICDVCSSYNENYDNLGDYTISEVYKNPGEKGTKYNFNMDAINQKMIAGWSKAVADKTKAYFDSLY